MSNYKTIMSDKTEHRIDEVAAKWADFPMSWCLLDTITDAVNLEELQLSLANGKCGAGHPIHGIDLSVFDSMSEADFDWLYAWGWGLHDRLLEADKLPAHWDTPLGWMIELWVYDEADPSWRTTP